MILKKDSLNYVLHDVEKKKKVQNEINNFYNCPETIYQLMVV